MTFSGKISFPSKVRESLNVLFNLVQKHSPVSFLGLQVNALVQLCSVHFVFVFLKNKVQTSQKNTREMFYYFIEKHMQKFRYFWRKTNFTRKSHLRPSCTKPFNYCQAIANTVLSSLFILIFITKLKIHHIYSFVTLPMTLTVLVLAVKLPKLLSVSFCSSVDIAPTHVFGRSWVQFLLGLGFFLCPTLM